MVSIRLVCVCVVLSVIGFCGNGIQCVGCQLGASAYSIIHALCVVFQ